MLDPTKKRNKPQRNMLAYRRSLLFWVDIIITALSFTASWLCLQKHLHFSVKSIGLHLTLTLVCTGVFLLLFRCYDSLWRYQESREYLTQFWALCCAHGLLAVVNFIIRPFLPSWAYYARRLQVLTMLLSLVVMWLFRFTYRYVRQSRSLQAYRNRAEVKIAIVGAGDAGVSLVDEMRRDKDCVYDVVCFFDDDPIKQRAHVRGIPVRGSLDTLSVYLRDTEVKEVIVAIAALGEERMTAVMEQCKALGIRVRVLPNVISQLAAQTGELLSHVRDVEAEDLLGRDAVIFDNKEVYDFLSDKVVMVTGGGGSIGSELCRQIALHHPRRLVVVDIYENNAYDLQQELRQKFADRLNLSVEIASVREADKVDLLFRRYRPQIVFHAAAHKHVPLMEGCPEEAIKNNVFGTYNVARAAGEYGAEKFVLISTDKAVNPTNVMGASKRLCEMVVQSMTRYPDTTYVAVRFGNVLGSNGSVIPLFKRQLASGGPLTVTDRRIIRYFMTIPEASQLVMQAGAMARQSQVFVLDMGEPVKILTLAENLVRMAGLTPYVDVDIIETGLRPGEKLYEELLMSSETLTSTKYNKIFVEEQTPVTPEQMDDHLACLRQVLETESPEQIVAVMRQIVPTFRTPEEVNAAAEGHLQYAHK